MTTLSAAPQSGVQILLQISEGMPVPKFSLFQRVSFESWSGKQQQGIVSGMEYIDPSTALIEGLSRFGWVYTVNRAQMPGMTPERLLEIDEPRQTFGEKDLSAA